MTEDFERSIHELHARRDLHVTMELSPRNRVQWRAVLSGDDFLDGPWSIEKTGYARDRKRAMRAIEKAFS